MLPLDLPGIIVVDRQQDERTFTLHAGCEGRPDACPGCRSESFIGHGQHPQEIIDLPHHGRFMAIQLVRKRYRCNDCGNTFFHPLDWIDDDHRATRRFVDRVAKLGLERNFSDIGREYGISEHAVREIFNNRYREIIDTTQFGAPAYLGNHTVVI